MPNEYFDAGAGDILYSQLEMQIFFWRYFRFLVRLGSRDVSL